MSIWDDIEQHRLAASEGATVTLSPEHMLAIIDALDRTGEALVKAEALGLLTTDTTVTGESVEELQARLTAAEDENDWLRIRVEELSNYGLVPGTPPPVLNPDMTPLDIDCPHCGATAGFPCHKGSSITTSRAVPPHASRKAGA